MGTSGPRIPLLGGRDGHAPHQEGFRVAVPVQEPFDGGHELTDPVPGLGPALAAGHGQVLAHLGVVHPQHFGHVRRRDLVLARVLQAGQVLVVAGKAAEGGEGDRWCGQGRLQEGDA